MKKNQINLIVLTFVAVFSISYMTACSYLNKKLVSNTTQLNAKNADIEEEQKALTKATDDALKFVPKDVSTNNVISNAVTVAKITSAKNVELHGLPVKPINVEAIATSPAIDKSAEYKELLARLDREQKLLEDKARIEAEREKLRDQLVDLGKKYEAEHNKSIITRIWEWTMGTIGIGGIIALCVLFPPALPILGSMLSWLIGCIPQLAHIFGVVGKNVLTNVTTGIEDFKSKLKNAPIEGELLRNVSDSHTFTKSEVQALLEEHSERNLELLNNSLAKATAPDTDRKLVSYLKPKTIS